MGLRPCTIDPRCYRLNGHAGPHLHAEDPVRCPRCRVVIIATPHRCRKPVK